MNWLAHLYLSEDNAAFRLGNILPDLVPVAALNSLPDDFQRGIARHFAIDAFTDSNPVFRRSILRLEPPFRRYGGILCDVLYNHFLAEGWGSYSTQSLADFTGSFYSSLDEYKSLLPPEAFLRLDQARSGDLFGTYQSIAGVQQALYRIDRRLKRTANLAGAIVELETKREALRSDFCEFFPMVCGHVSATGALKRFRL